MTNNTSGQSITMTPEEFQKQWDAYHKARRQPKKVYMQDGKCIAGENISMGDLVYLEPTLRIAPRNSGMTTGGIYDSSSTTKTTEETE